MTSRPITPEEHILIMKTMNENHDGFFKRNIQVIHILTVEGSIGLRLGDILRMRLSDIYHTDNGYRLKIVEEKTGKERNVPIPSELYAYLTEYAMSENRNRNDTIFNITCRAVNKYIRKVVDFLEMESISSHSWRKMYALNVYEKTGNDIVAVQQALLHSSVAVTQRYLNRRSEKLEKFLKSNSVIVDLS